MNCIAYQITITSFFFLAPATNPNSQAHRTLAERIETLCQQLTAENHDLSRLIQGLFSLHLKMVMLEKASERFRYRRLTSTQRFTLTLV